MTRRAGRLLCSGLLQADLPDDADGWGQLCRAARSAHLLPAEVDRNTREFLYRPSLSPRESEAAWKVCVDTQRHELAAGLQQAERARAALVRLGEPVDGSPSPEPLPTTPPPESLPEAAPPAAQVAPTPPPASELSQPQPAPPPPRVTDAQAIAISAVMAAARESRQWYRLAVCTLAVDGLEVALAIEELPSAAAARLRLLSEADALTKALQWAAVGGS